VWQNSFAVYAGNVDSDRESRIFPCDPYRTIKRITRNHQAAACENASLMGLNYSPAYFLGSPEIVAIHDQVFSDLLHISRNRQRVCEILPAT
jgi:hypothetical protein